MKEIPTTSEATDAMANFLAEKRALVAQISQALGAELTSLRTAALAAHEAATHAESRAENKYDTRGLEASYLAGAQAARAAELEAQLKALESLQLRPLPPGQAGPAAQRVAPTALVEVLQEGETAVYFVLAYGAGLALTWARNGDPVTLRVLTPQSPLGRALLGRVAGDSVTVAAAAGTREVEVVGVW